MADAKVSIALEAIDKASPELKKFQKNLDATAKRAADAGRVIGTAFAAMATAIAVGTKAAINSADEISKAAQQVGLSVEALSSLKFAGALSDVGFDELKVGLLQFNKQLSASADPASRAATAFDVLGIKVRDAAGALQPTEAIINQLATAFQNAKDGPEKTAIAMELFGKSGAKLIPLLNQGEAGLAAFRAEAEKLGLVISGDTAKAAEEFNDTITRMNSTISGQFLKLAKELLPILQAVADALLNNVKNGGQIQEIFRGIAMVIKLIIPLFAKVSATVIAFTRGIVALGVAVSEVLTGNFTGAVDVIESYIADTNELEASTNKFIASLEEENKVVKESTVSMTNNNQKTLESIDAKRKQEQASKKTQDAIAALADEIRKSDASLKDLSLSEQVSFKLQGEKYSALSSLQKQALTNLAKEIELKNLIYAIDKKTKEQAVETYTAQISQLDTIQRTLTTSQQYYNTLISRGQEAADSQQNFNSLIETHIAQLDQLKNRRAALIAQGKVEEAAVLSGQMGSLQGSISAMELAQPLYTQLYKDQQKINRQTELYNSTLGAIDKKQRRVEEGLIFLDEQYQKGAISIDKYTEAWHMLLGVSSEPLIEEVSKLDEFVVAAAHSMQNSMSTFFFDIMQGKVSDFAGNMKRAIDKIVADMLAAQAATFLFGDYGKTGKAGGAIGNLLGGLGGLFKAEGGQVNRGSPYIVGEAGPEVFVPSVGGNIIPNKDAGSMYAPGNNINITIKALDSQDVMRSMDKVKRELTTMIQGTQRSYNLRAV